MSARSRSQLFMNEASLARPCNPWDKLRAAWRQNNSNPSKQSTLTKNLLVYHQVILPIMFGLWLGFKRP